MKLKQSASEELLLVVDEIQYKGMSVFAEKFKLTKVMLVGTGGMPIEDFLKMNPIDLF